MLTRALNPSSIEGVLDIDIDEDPNSPKENGNASEDARHKQDYTVWEILNADDGWTSKG